MNNNLLYNLNMARSYAYSHSHDAEIKVGCLLTDNKTKYILGTNKFPDASMKDTISDDDKHPHIIHAELECFGKALELYGSVPGLECYITHPPCKDCAEVLICLEISNLYVLHSNLERWLSDVHRWRNSITEGFSLLKSEGIGYYVHNEYTLECLSGESYFEVI